MTDAEFENDVYIKKFKNSFKYEEPPDVTCTKIFSEEGTFLKFTVLFYLNEKCSCQMKIKTPLEDPGTLHPLSLKIRLTNKELEHEIQPCINYLQRQRCPDFVVCVLQKVVNLYSQRSIIINMLMREFEDLITISKDDENGIVIHCAFREKLFFKSSWKISCDIYIGCPFDNLDFVVNRRDKYFYNSVVTYMKLLTQVAIASEKKLLFWRNIMKEVETFLAVKSEIEVVDISDDTETVTGPIIENRCNNCTVNDIPVIEVESSDSDDNTVLIVD
ncbi:uncharacterized protein LOC112904445 [Agrilus planipennis]|uniref:Uncharacterized protein LOC108742422 n=1 Tax=Agrilus planipennis TaxID=224129 RepID=A0A1W4XAH6_AGRPL|nr:uncharacterized protein LOC108742422 [Agrilus planipennis]XP_025830290.1 uncharacterized protein LOC112904445 [Agrilus planipennis]